MKRVSYAASSLSRRFGSARFRSAKKLPAAEAELEEEVLEFLDGVLQGKEEHLEVTLEALRRPQQSKHKDKEKHRQSTFELFVEHLHGLRAGVVEQYNALQNWAVLNKTRLERLVRDFDLMYASPRRGLGGGGPGGKRLLVLDFDKTLAVIDVGTFDPKAEGEKERVWGSAERYEAILALLKTVEEDSSIISTIVSFNTETVIHQVLEKAGLKEYFKHVVGREAFFSSGYPMKSRKILELMVKEKVQQNDHVIFLDDNPRNIHDVNQFIPGSNVVWVRDAMGITNEHHDKVLEWMANSGQVAPETS